MDDQGTDREGGHDMHVQGVSAIVLVIGVAIGIGCWLIGAANAFIMFTNRKEGVSLFPAWYKSPVEIVYRPQNLTERGLAARRRCIFGFVGFIASAVITCGLIYLIETFIHPAH